jgi:hypothetical protein
MRAIRGLASATGPKEDRLSAAQAVAREAESRPGASNLDRHSARSQIGLRGSIVLDTSERDRRTRIVQVYLFQESGWLFRLEYDADKEWA